MAEPHHRLDSWKAIADYLGRDVRTLRRWERQGFPVHRVPGGPGHSVFAFQHEIDAWLKAGGAARRLPAVTAPAAIEEAPPPAPDRTPRRVPWRPLAAVAVIIVGLMNWKNLPPSAAAPDWKIQVTAAGVVALDNLERERWRRNFPADIAFAVPTSTLSSQVLAGEQPGVLVATAYGIRHRDQVPVSGELRWFGPDGSPLRLFTFDDRFTFAGRAFEAPWALADFQVHESGSRRRVAVAAHHYTRWPSIVTILNERWEREGTFVHSGWVEDVRWISPDRLVMAGFNQDRDGGMIGWLDAADINGSSPERRGSEFECDGCGRARPVSYAVLPRSEVNRVTGSPFNGATLALAPGRVLATTSEVDRDGPDGAAAGALYEFSSDGSLVSSSYNDRYWDHHRALEIAGKLDHSREKCPEHDGPRLIQIWDPARGWRSAKTGR